MIGVTLDETPVYSPETIEIAAWAWAINERPGERIAINLENPYDVLAWIERGEDETAETCAMFIQCDGEWLVDECAWSDGYTLYGSRPRLFN